MRTTIVSSCVLALLATQPARGATYYVDASAGSDAWAGTQASATAGNGPWRSLGRVAGAALVAGDAVLLKCGSTWNESLRVTRSGTSANPITIGHYPAGCANKPIIDGTTTVPAHAWKHYAGGIYRATLPVNLVRNAQFDEGTSHWSSWSPDGKQRLEIDSACDGSSSTCLKFTSATGTSLANSSSFLLDGMESLSITFRMHAPLGVRVRVALRRASAPWDTIGFSTFIDGSGAWQTHAFNAPVAANASAGRLDFEIPGGAKVIRIDNVRISGSAAFAPRRLYAGADMLLPAHHPNRGHDPNQPQSVFARIAADADRVAFGGKTVSTYLDTGPGLALPAGQVLTPGLGIAIRTNNWLIDELAISSVAGNRVYLSAPTTYALSKNWGYYLTGALWMLDRPGEWFYDASTRDLYAWMFDDNAPPDVRVAHRLNGVDISGTAYVTIDGLDIRGFDTAVRMQQSAGGRIQNSALSDSGQNGINAHWSTAAVIDQNTITNSGRDAITGFLSTGGPAADRMTVRNNVIANSGVRNGSTIHALPVRSYAAIRAGTNAVVSGNDVRQSGYLAIWPAANSIVDRNYVASACLVLNDCGSIYVNGANTAARITNNIVMDPVGNLDGVPLEHFTMAQGIYLDDFSSNVYVAGNTIARADHGLHLHNGTANTIEGNSIYGNRRYQLWMQEDTNKLRAGGDVWQNHVAGNRIFPTSSTASIRHDTLFSGTSAFSSYAGNRYAALMSPLIAAEAWAGGSAAYTLAEWQAAKTPSGTPRNLDAGATQVTGAGYTPFRIVGTNLVPNGSFTSGALGWTKWNATAPLGTATLQTCPQGTCLHYVAGGSISLLSSPNFSLVKDQWYRVSFDAKVGVEGQGITIAVRRGGGGANGYELLADSPANFTGSTAWKRYTFAFKATKSVNAADPVTLDLGARIDFEKIQPGTTITVGNVQLYPLGATTMQTRILVNPTAATKTLDCPDLATNPDLCAQFVRFSDGAIAYWPQSIGPYRSEIVYSRDPALVDSDGDGIADSQDTCPGTAPGAMTNARGCSFAQSPAG